MNFSRIIGKIDPELVDKAAEKLSQVFLELGTRYNNEHVGTGMGGDPLIFGLMYPVEHICTTNIPTAATDGKRYYWNPKFVLKQSRIGLRIICGHEAWHAIYMHPQRRGSRLPKLWNIAVDYIVNGTVMDDFKARKMNPSDMFNKHLGKFMTLEQYASLLKDPFSPVKGFEDLNPTPENTAAPSIDLPSPTEDRDLTPQEQQELEKKEKNVKFYFADPDLEEEMRRPEKIYDYLYSLLPKCPKCGSVGMYKLPNKNKDKNKGKDKDKDKGKSKDKDKDKGKDKQEGKDKSDQDHNHGGDQPCDCDCPCGSDGDQPGDGQGDQPGQCCGGCGGGIDIFGLGGTVDDHLDTSETEEKLAKRISDAMEAARKMAGHVPAALEDELGKLTAPKVSWQDIIRTRLLKARAGNGRNDWTRFRSRPMFTGLLVPKRKNYYAHFGCLLDTSGSMSKDDMAFGLSQLCALDERSEGTIIPADAQIYWDKATKVKKAVPDEIMKVKIFGRGGTKYAEFFTDYEKNIGKCDFLIVITDGFLLDTDLAEMKHPGIDTIWLITSGSAFTPPFGRAFDLRS
ncbi:VWA-like domain containing protein [uncultured Caudovirales phage]|uniref:VWA-like domain containing protein n=1 Tax=uncultured Caudovirales phage TaxID=2100421 RepID=A0A6J5RIX3_9CAUD|nr:VWA-like domain containing protein [uncultured Caudovirales phage]